MAEALQSRLIRAEHYFLSSITHGPSETAIFFQFWEALEMDLSKAMEANDVDNDTLDLAQRVVSRVETLASEFMVLTEESETLISTLQQEVQLLFSNLTLGHVVDETDQLPSLPCYIEAAYTWLLKNLHNPYPSKAIKSSIARQAGCSPKQVDSWFISVRKRVGWNHLRATCFSNKRSLIVAEATNFFLYNTGKRGDDYFMEFMKIKNKVDALYLNKLEFCLPSEPCPRVCKRKPPSKRGVLPYPSPEPESDSNFSTLKRCRSIERAGEGSSTNSKRPRSELAPISDELAIASLPSPAPSLREVSDSTVVAEDFSSPVLCKRKRRLSEGDSQRPCKRQHPVPSSPRLHTVSNPLPLPHAEDEALPDYFSFDMNLPSYVTGMSVGDTIPCEVTFPYAFSPWTGSSSLTSETSSPSESPDASVLALPPPAASIFEDSTFASDECLWGFQDRNTSPGIVSIMPPLCQLDSAFSDVALGIHNPSDILDWSTLLCVPNVIQPIFHNDPFAFNSVIEPTDRCKGLESLHDELWWLEAN